MEPFDQLAALSPEQLELLRLMLADEGIEASRLPIPRAPRPEGRAPASFAQQRLWLLHQIEPASPRYNLPIGIELRGTLHPSALAAALQDVVRRHEMLRTVFEAEGGRPVQVVLDPAFSPLPRLPEVDLSGLSTARGRAVLARLMRARIDRPFDLGRAPLFHTTLFRLAPEIRVLLLVVHHIAADAWSMAVWVEEIAAAYRSRSLGLPAELPPLPIQYADFAQWQLQRLAGDFLTQEIAHWRGRLDRLTPLVLPSDRPRGATSGFRGGTQRALLAPSLLASLHALAQRRGVTLFAVLTAALDLLLARYCGLEDVAIGSPVAGRNRVEVERLIGFFVNLLVLRTRLEGDLTFATLLDRVQETTLDALAHQELPFEKLVEMLQPERRLGETPFFSVLLTLQNVPRPELDLGGILLRSLPVAPSATRFDWILYAREESALELTLEYRAELFDATTCASALQRFETLLTAAVTAPERRLSELPLLNPVERHQLLQEWALPEDAPGPVSYLELFESWAARSPALPALVASEGLWSYGELNARANRWARRLRALGVGPDVPVVLYLERSASMILGLLAILKAGGVYVPIEPPVPRLYLEHMVTGVGASVALTSELLAGDLPPQVTVRLCIDAPASLAALSAEPADDLALAVPEQALAYVIFTSGSTGSAKAVGIERAHLARYLHGILLRLSPPPNGRFALLSTMAADLGNTALFAALCTGGCLHVLSRHIAADAEVVASYFELQPIDFMKIVPSHLRALLTSTRPQSIVPRQLLVLGGEACDRALARQLADLAPACRVFNHYGPTETTIGVIAGPILAGEGQDRIPLGRPLRPARCYVLDRFMQPLPCGVPGELYVGGGTVARGYLSSSDRTAASFLPDPWSPFPGARSYRTGDLVRLRRDGRLEFLGRIDQQVKIRGLRVEPEGIEALLREHPEVSAAAVTVTEDVGGKRLRAYVVAASSALTAEELRSFLRARLPEAMLPADLVFLPALPLGPNGKLDRRALPAPEPLVPGTSGRRPATPMEELVGAVWCDVLERAEVDADRDFFASGGHSLQATRVASRLSQILGSTVPLRLLFEAPTVARQASALAAQMASESLPALPAIGRRGASEGDLPLSFAQERLWVLDRLALQRTAYLLHYFVELHGPLAPASLSAALTEVVRRHEVLRTCFPSRNGRPLQVVLESSTVVIPVIDLYGLEGRAGSPAREEITRLAEAETGRGFDLAQERPLRALLVRRDDSGWTLLLTLHHIASDGWSRGILEREILSLYSGLRRGESVRLPELPVQYADFALWQRAALRGEALGALLAYWRRQLAGCEGAELPADRPRPPVPSYRGAALGFVLPGPLLSEVHALAQRRGLTPFMVLLAALAALLHRYTGRDDVALGSPVAHRNHPQIEPLIGFFVNMLVLRLPASGSLSFRELLERARGVALAAYTHQDLPFEKLLEELPLARDPGRQPLFQMVFALQNAPAAGCGPDGLTIKPYEVDHRTAKFDLSLLAKEGEDGLACAIEYSTDLFDRTTVERFRRHWANLLTGAVRVPETALAELPLLTPPELHQLLGEWNRLGPGKATICAHHLFAAQVQRQPSAPALSWSGGALSYSALDRQANRLAHRLRALGVEAESRVGLSLSRSPEMVVALLAVWKAGGAYVPLDPEHPGEYVLARIRDSGCAVVIGGVGDLGALLARDGVQVVEIAGDRDDESLGDAAPPELASPRCLAYVLYTSGTTGQPKGVMVSHHALVNYLLWSAIAYRVPEGGRSPVHSSLGFDLTVTSLLTPLVAGGTVVLLPEEHGVEALRHGLVAGPSFSLLKLTPAHLELLARQASPGRAIGADLLVVGGEALLSERLSWLREHSPEIRLVNEYGPTEAVVGCAIYEVPPGSNLPRGAVPIGRPIAGGALHLVDAEMRLVPLGAVGEILIAGEGLGRGYLGQPAWTAERWIPDPFGGVGERLYRSGDLARRLADGNLSFLGRRDTQVKIRGHRIDLGEIEANLARHPGLRDAAIAALPDSAGHLELVGYGVAKDRPISEKELRRFLADRLPDVLVPARFVLLSELPLTPNGKVDRSALPRPEVQRSGDLGRSRPRNPAESVVAAVWRQVLRREAMGLHENFFDLGGNSLLLVELQELLRQAFAREISAIDLFRYPTIAAQVAFFMGADGEEAARSKPAPGAGALAACENDVAVIGLVGRFPGADTMDELWQALSEGRELISFFSVEELTAAGLDPALVRRPEYVRAGGVLAGADEFDAAFFNQTPREAELTDPQQRLFLELAWSALEDAGYAPGLDPGRVGVFAGSSLNRYWLNLAARPDLTAGHEIQLMFNNDKDFLPTRISYKLNLKGPSIAVQTACSSSLVAVHLACSSLLRGECDMALAGGVSVRVPQGVGYLYQEGGIASPDGHCRPFSAQARGTVSGSGLGIVVLKRLADALRDGDCIRAVIKGSAINNDGAAKVGYSAPSFEGQAEVIAAALAAAGVEPESISYVEAHGTGTALGDPVEVAALSQVLGGPERRGQACALGSIKSNMGHLDAASGIAGLIKTVLACERRQLPPSLHFDRPNPRIDFAASPFYVNTALADWTPATGPRRAGVSSFGIGGTNAHVIVEEAPARPPAAPVPPWQLVLLSASSESALATVRERLSARLEERPQEHFADVAYTLQVGRRRLRHRLMLVCQSAGEAVCELADPTSRHAISQAGEESERPIAFLFPGQGSQHVRMGRELYRHEEVFRAVVDDGADLLAPSLGLDLRRVLDPAPGDEEWAAEQLRSTAFAQPALFLVEYALARLWMSLGLTPELMVGHSLGEYVAACLANVFRFEDALTLVSARGRLMASCAPGAMLSVALPESELVSLLSPGLSLAAINGPLRCVVSGPLREIEALEKRLADRELSFRRLATSHAFHCELVDPILDRFREEVEAVELHPPERAIISSVSGALLAGHEATDPAYWTRQMRLPVRFGEALRAVAGEPRRALLEVGPGQVLTSLVRHDPELCRRLAVASLPHSRHEESDLVTFLGALGRLWLNGAPIDWRARHAGAGRRRVPLPTYPFERKRYWVEAPAGGALPVAPQLREGRVENWFLHAAWRKTAPARLLSPHRRSGARPWLVFGHSGGLSAAVGEALRRRGESVITVAAAPRPASLAPDAYAIRSDHADDYTQLMGELRRRNQTPAYILYFWSLRQESAAAETALHLFCYSLLYLVQALILEESAPIHLGLVSAGMHEITGEEDLDPEQALLLGLCRCLPVEAPHVTCRSIDLSPREVRGALTEPADSSLATTLVDELLLDTADEVVGYRHGGRWVETFETLDLASQPMPALPLREGGVYLITGGLGGVGCELAAHLATAVRARLVLVGRSPIPPPAEYESWVERLGEAAPLSVRIRRLQALAAAGAEVLVASADVADPDQVREVVRQARQRFGAVHGVIHAAGVPSSGLLATKTAERAGAVLSPKVLGARSLASVFAEGDLDFLVLCSSLRTVLGGAGRSDYVAANAFLDAFSYQMRRAMPRTTTVTIDWDTWRDTGMSAEAACALGQRPEEAFPTALSSQEGVEVFRRALACALPRLLVSTQDLTTVRTQARQVSVELLATRSTAATHARPVDARYVAPRTEAETTLVAIWEELLGIAPVGVHENFFELGGDSIVGLQVAARAKKRGLELSPRQVFEGQTIAELAAAVGSAPPSRRAVRCPAITGPVPLTPIQQWFFSRPLPDRHHWNQSVLLQVATPIDPRSLAGALSALIAHHETLWLSFHEEAGSWQASGAVPTGAAPLTVVDLSGLPPEARTAALQRSAACVQGSFNLGRPPLLRIVLYRCGAGPERLLLVAHHLVVDAVSWRILLEDLEDAVEQLQAARELALPPPTTSFPEWARLLEAHATSPELAVELDYWLARGQHAVPPLPLDHPAGANLIAAARSLDTHLDQEETRDLLEEASKSLHADLQTLLLYGLARAFARWTGESRLRVDLEGHGREPLFAEVDLSRTLGWFTALFPLLLELPSGGDELAALRRIKEQAQSCPGHGVGYGLLRYLATAASRSGLARLPQAEIKLLYLGQMDRVLRSGSRFSEAPESSGPSVARRAPRSHLFDVTARVFAGELRISWTYGERLHARRTVEGLAQGLLEELRALVGLSRAPATTVYTSSDFPQADLSDSELVELMAELQRNGEK